MVKSPIVIPKKTLQIEVDHIGDTPELDIDPHGPSPIIISGASENEWNLRIEVDGETVFEIPKFNHFTVSGKFMDIDRRLRLLEEILFSADVNGTAVVVRSEPDKYEVLDPSEFMLMSKGD